MFAKKRWLLFFLTALFGAAFLLLVWRTVVATNRDAWAYGVVDVVSTAVLRFSDETGDSAVSVEDLVARGFLIVGEEDGAATIATPPPHDVGPVRIESLTKIRLHFPESIEGWRIVNGAVVDENGDVTGLPRVEISGYEYLDDGLAVYRNQRFAKAWLKLMHGRRLGE